MGKSSQERHAALESQFLALQKLKEKSQRVGRESFFSPSPKPMTATCSTMEQAWF